MAKTKVKRTAKKTKCEIGSTLVCSGECIRRYRGVLKGDPEFNCCIACAAYLRRQGVRFKEVQSS